MIEKINVIEKVKKYATNFWWLLVITSITSIVFGLVTLLMPGITLLTIIMLFAGLVMVQGIIEIVTGIGTTKTDSKWWLPVLLGIILVVAGIYLARHPAMSLAAFIGTVVAVMISRGVLDLWVGITLNHNRIYFILLGILNIVAGILVWIYPLKGTFALAFALGVYGIVHGTLVLSAALAMRSEIKSVMK